MLKVVYFLILGLVLLFLFHFESLAFGIFKISHLWKSILLGYLLIKLKLRRDALYIYTPLFVILFFQLFSREIVYNPINGLLLFLTSLLLPIFGMFSCQLRIDVLYSFLFFIVGFITLSFIPYYFGWLVSYGEGYDLSKWGGDNYGLVGPFQNVHSASTALASSFLVLLYFFLNNRISRLIIFSLLCLSLFFLFSTYARTGLLMALIGSLPILAAFFQKFPKYRILVVLLTFFIAAVTIYLISNNEILENKLAGNRLRQSELESFETLGSGRGSLLINSLVIYADSNIFEKIIGVGESYLVFKMGEIMGTNFVPHNGFLYILLSAGFIGLIFFYIFLKRIYKLSKGYIVSDQILLKSLFYAYLVMTFFQNYDRFYAFTILSILVAIVLKKQKLVNKQIYSL